MARNAAHKTVVCTARCEDCGNLTANTPWSPGTACPHCGSHHFAPVPRVREGSDYESADRSQGFAIEDIRFGRMALWAGLITQKRFQMALREQQRIGQSGRTVPDLGKLLVQKKLLTKRQRDTLVRGLSAVPGNSADREFMEAATKSGYIADDKMAACEALQARIAREGLDAPPLPLLVYERRLLQENQVIALLKALEQRERGLLYSINGRANGSKESAIAGLFGSAKDRQSKTKQIASIAIILFAAVFFIVRFTGVPAQATIQCEECGAVSGAPENSDWPLECPECGKKAMYPLVMCRDCGERYISKGIGYGKSCPKCKSPNFIPVTNKTKADLDKIEQEIEARKTRRDAL